MEPDINMVDTDMFHPDILGKYTGHNGYGDHNGYNGGVEGVVMNGKKKNLHQLHKWKELHQSCLSVPGNMGNMGVGQHT